MPRHGPSCVAVTLLCLLRVATTTASAIFLLLRMGTFCLVNALPFYTLLPPSSTEKKKCVACSLPYIPQVFQSDCQINRLAGESGCFFIVLKKERLKYLSKNSYIFSNRRKEAFIFIIAISRIRDSKKKGF